MSFNYTSQCAKPRNYPAASHNHITHYIQNGTTHPAAPRNTQARHLFELTPAPFGWDTPTAPCAQPTTALVLTLPLLAALADLSFHARLAAMPSASPDQLAYHLSRISQLLTDVPALTSLGHALHAVDLCHRLPSQDSGYRLDSSAPAPNSIGRLLDVTA